MVDLVFKVKNIGSCLVKINKNEKCSNREFENIKMADLVTLDSKTRNNYFCY